MPQEYLFEPIYRCHFEAPNIFFVKTTGTADEKAITWLLDTVGAVLKEHGQLVVLIDSREAQGMTAGARRILGDQKNFATVRWALFGASFAMRTVVTMAVKALSLVGLATADSAPAFFKTEDEARAWAASQAQGKTG